MEILLPVDCECDLMENNKTDELNQTKIFWFS